MDERTTRLAAGVLLFAGGALALLATLFPGIDLPALAYVPIGLVLFGGVYLIGLSNPDRTV